MKLLVLAQIPPPVHGQSVMVETLVRGLPAHGIKLEHVDLRLSRDATDIGRWRWGKLAAVVDACVHAVLTRFRASCDTLYYVPAPGKRGALYRDWVVMLLCRPFFRHLVLHWHAAGLGEWLRTRAIAPERALTRLLLGRADLSIVLGEALRDDAEFLAARRIAVVPNGIADPCPGYVRPARRDDAELQALFLGLIAPDKGVFDAIAAIRHGRATLPGFRWRLVLAGAVPDDAIARELERRIAECGGAVRYVGFVQGAVKDALLRESDALVFPTYYAAETQGLVVAEALAYDLPVVVTKWRAVAENLPESHVHIVPIRSPREIGSALEAIARAASTTGIRRQYFLVHLATSVHLKALAATLSMLRHPVS